MSEIELKAGASKGDIRIALWNVLRADGVSDHRAYSVIRRTIKALNLSSPATPDAVLERALELDAAMIVALSRAYNACQKIATETWFADEVTERERSSHQGAAGACLAHINGLQRQIFKRYPSMGDGIMPAIERLRPDLDALDAREGG